MSAASCCTPHISGLRDAFRADISPMVVFAGRLNDAEMCSDSGAWDGKPLRVPPPCCIAKHEIIEVICEWNHTHGEGMATVRQSVRRAQCCGSRRSRLVRARRLARRAAHPVEFPFRMLLDPRDGGLLEAHGAGGEPRLIAVFVSRLDGLTELLRMGMPYHAEDDRQCNKHGFLPGKRGGVVGRRLEIGGRVFRHRCNIVIDQNGPVRLSLASTIPRQFREATSPIFLDILVSKVSTSVVERLPRLWDWRRLFRFTGTAAMIPIRA